LLTLAKYPKQHSIATSWLMIDFDFKPDPAFNLTEDVCMVILVIALAF